MDPHQPVVSQIAQSAHGQAGAVVLILVAPVVLSGGRDIKRVMRNVVVLALMVYLSHKHVTEAIAIILVHHTVQGVTVDLDLLELAVNMVSF